uniref:non-specific serine/threonine protein kinase n=1 Tax=Clytia hemisphaerica TaxID=252671 RepID=A0A7M5VAP0_9CNID
MDKAEALFNDKVDGNVVGPSTDSSGSELIYLCYNGNFQTIQLLIKSNQQLLLDKACGGIGDCPKVEHKPTWKKLQEVLLRKHETYTVGDLLLCVACILQNQTLVELLTNRGVDVNHGTTKHELLSPLYIACINEDIEMITYLMNNKAEVISVIAKEFPTLISQVLEKRIEEYKVPRRKGKMKNSQKKKTMYRLCWENSHLHALNKDWFMVEKYNITRVELPRNKLTKLVDGFFQLLPLLEELDVASNHLMALPSDHLANSKLKRLDVSSNQLRSLPESLFFNQNIVVIDASSNQLSSLPHTHTNWKCSALEKFVCSKNELTELPKSIAGANRIQILNLSRNKFEVFNRWWKCPLVDVNLSFNHIKDFTLKTDSFWSKTIKTLNLTRNNLDFIPSSILHLTKLENLKLARNALKTLPRPDLWKTKRLLDLDLSYNQITTTPITDGFLDLETEEVEYNNTCELPVKIFADTLQSLNLAHNLLDEIPETLCQLKALGRLDLSHNTGLTFLPPKLGLLKNIWSLNLSGLDIKNVPHKFEGLNHVKVLSFLRAKLRKSKPFNRIKLMLVGLQGRGKTTLVHAIQGKPPPPNISTVGIIVEQFVLPLRNQYYFYSSPSPEIMFSVWDLAGQQVYYATHQCFLSGKTLYLVVYNVTHGSEGIDSLGSWLLNIQARAPNSRCIIVGTHVDKMPVYRKEETLIKYRKQIMDKFMKEGFPAISKCVFVSGTSNENIEELREVVYKEAEAMNHQSDLGKLAPISYLELYDQIIMESVRRNEQQRPPVLTTEEMLQLAEQNTNNDIMDFEELCTASQFLHENGVLLHFNDHLRGLNNLFFIDPSWLIDIVALVVTVRQRNPYVQKGYITEQELLYILKNPWLPEKFIPQYLRLLERFEILLSLEDGKFLIPCMLSEEKPDIEHKMLHVITSEEIRHHQINVERTTNYLTRNYHMQYVPAGFWARLIARLVIAVQKWSLQIQQDGNTGYTKQLWRKGLMVTYEDGYFLIESFHDQELRPKKWSNQGVSITVWSKTKDFSVMGFIVDHMEMLITEWYPGLEGINDYGDNLVQKLISCPICCAQKAIDLVQCCDQNTISLRNHYGSFFRNEFFINQFPLDTCAYAAIDHQEIICVKHPDQPVRLELLIPEIMMTDLPQKYCITEDSLDFDPHTSRKLGDGGAGVVYLGRYDDEDVAIKRSHSVIMKESQQGEGAFDPSDRSVTQLLSLDDGRVVKSFWEMRQEVLVLCTLQHANIVKFLGVCFSPLCFVIEFAPMGSLFGILEKEQKKAELPILGMQLTYLILFQITEAIKYLHSWNIIYRDLKSENVLVMSLDPQQTINVKLPTTALQLSQRPRV